MQAIDQNGVEELQFEVSLRIELTRPWPSAAIRLQKEIRGYLFEVVSLASGRILISATALHSKVAVLPLLSQKIEAVGEEQASLLLSLRIIGSEQQALRGEINGHPISEWSGAIRTENSPDATSDKAPIFRRQEIYRSQINRRGQLQDKFHGHTVDSIRSRQLGHLSELIECLELSATEFRNGNRVRRRTLLAELRVLICSGKGNRVLQDCAAFLERPLLVWTSETSLPPVRALFSWGDEFISFNLTRNLNVQTDLDAWLDSAVIYFDLEEMSNKALISMFADKAGSHADVIGIDRLDGIDGLAEGMKIDIGGFVLQLADVVILLGHELLQTASD